MCGAYPEPVQGPSITFGYGVGRNLRWLDDMWHNRAHIWFHPVLRGINKSINQSYGNKRAESTQAALLCAETPIGN
jgi:hypothetical protein